MQRPIDGVLAQILARWVDFVHRHASGVIGVISAITVALAEDLYEEKLPGDEPEPLEVITWKLSDLDRLLEREDVTEARVIAALLMTRRILENR